MMRRAVCAIAVAFQMALVMADASTNAVFQAVRTAMEAYVDQKVEFECRDAGFVRNMGLPQWQSQAYTNLALTVSNSLDVIVGNLDACATNQFERYVVMGTGWVFDDNYYLAMFNRLMDQVAVGRLTLDDVRWYNSGHHSNARLNTLARKFDLPIVSNILEKVEAAGGDTNYCNRVRSGEAKRMYDEIEAEMSILREP